ncbi:MAG TPA: CCA tRNA nucleotidyltransferase [Patescibacteria group bacterium]|nr:CCA tRNA nucleotidyltransferase [Patescibacteria group bacterium]
MQVQLPEPVKHILHTLQKGGYEAFVVGGAVRDVLLGAPVKDWDFTTNATPDEILKLFPDGFYDNTFGTVGVAGKHIGYTENPDEVFEITTYRSEGVYSDHRRPDTVQWGKTIEEDIQRRDFTINAMALDGERVIDPYGGQKDLQNHTIRAVGNPTIRFQEDALRMMRAIRIGAQLGFTIEQTTLKAIHAQSTLITHISWERIRDEFLKILTSEYPEEGIQLLASTNLLSHIMPELLECRGVEQAHHHIYDVWTHALKAVKACPSKDPIVRLAVLVHDIGKPVTADTSSKAVTFYNHEVVGARIARTIAERLRLSKKDIQRVFTLVRWHMFVYDKQVTDAYIRRFIRRVGTLYIKDMIDLRVADRIGSGAKPTSWRLEEMKERIEGQLHQPFSMNDLVIDGNDLMKEFRLQPGPQVGKILQTLFKRVLESPDRNTKEMLLEEAKKLL